MGRRFVMSDVHAEYELFMKLLSEIGFTEEDEIYIFGDIIDKGESSVRLAKYIFSQDNIFVSLGNHEYEFLKLYEAQMQESDGDYDAVLERLRAYFPNDGHLLDWETVDRIESLPLYIERDDFIGVHAGVQLDKEGRAIPPALLPLEEIIYNRSFKSPSVLPRESKCVFFGHTSARAIFPDASIIVYKKEGTRGDNIRDYIKVHLDTGAFVSGILGCFCIDDCRCYFVKRDEAGLVRHKLARFEEV